MATYRKIAFRNDQFYHIFNRGIERRTVFTTKKEFNRAKQLIKFYRHKEIPLRFSRIMQQPNDVREKILEKLYKNEKIVEILAFCLMPNHFHFLLKQVADNGVATFISNITNAYTKYFNTKHKRVGPLFQGTFNAVIVETDEQLIHLSRYIHLNPVVSSIIDHDKLENYSYSSYLEYLSLSDDEITEHEFVLTFFKKVNQYQEFVNDQIDYAKKLETIKHLVLE